MRNLYWLPIFLFCLAITINSALGLVITGDNFLITGVNFTEPVSVENSVNGTFSNCSFTDTIPITSINSTEISAPYNYWGTDYPPDLNISGNITIEPWWADEELTILSSNYKPVMVAIPTQSVQWGKTLSLLAVCTDQNVNDTLVFTDNSTLFDINASTGNITWVASVQGTFTGNEVSCSDGEYQSSREFDIISYFGSGYITSYVAADLPKVVIDNIVGIGAALFMLVSVIAVILLWRLFNRERLI